ncbi:hypothetical protein RUM43_010212, partial [Polyplax serrata]
VILPPELFASNGNSQIEIPFGRDGSESQSVGRSEDEEEDEDDVPEDGDRNTRSTFIKSTHQPGKSEVAKDKVDVTFDLSQPCEIFRSLPPDRPSLPHPNDLFILQ